MFFVDGSRCTYRFEGDSNVRVAIEVTRLRLGGRQCRNDVDTLTHRRHCSCQNSGNATLCSPATAFLQIQERPWENMLLTRDCICDTSLLPFRYVSSSPTLEAIFQVDSMANHEDYHDFFFEISYEFLTGMKCTQQNHLQGPGGVITLDGVRGGRTSVTGCNRQTWFLQPRPDRFIFLSTTGQMVSYLH